MGATFVVFMLVALCVFNLLPAMLAMSSGRLRGKERDLWVLAVLFTSWLGFLAFMTATTLDAPRKRALEEKRRSLPALDISDHRPD